MNMVFNVSFSVFIGFFSFTLRSEMHLILIFCFSWFALKLRYSYVFFPHADNLTRIIYQEDHSLSIVVEGHLLP